jgi:hypothetical protein
MDDGPFRISIIGKIYPILYWIMLKSKSEIHGALKIKSPQSETTSNSLNTYV